MINMLGDKTGCLFLSFPDLQTHCDLHSVGHADPVKVFLLKLLEAGLSLLDQ